MTRLDRVTASRLDLAHQLAAMPPLDRIARVQHLMATRSVQVYRGPDHLDFRLRLLGRTATSTSSAAGAVSNWIAATLKEAGLG